MSPIIITSPIMLYFVMSPSSFSNICLSQLVLIVYDELFGEMYTKQMNKSFLYSEKCPIQFEPYYITMGFIHRLSTRQNLFFNKIARPLLCFLLEGLHFTKHLYPSCWKMSFEFACVSDKHTISDCIQLLKFSSSSLHVFTLSI